MVTELEARIAGVQAGVEKSRKARAIIELEKIRVKKYNVNEVEEIATIEVKGVDVYEVEIEREKLYGELQTSCTCPDYKKNGGYCKHILAGMYLIKNKTQEQMEELLCGEKKNVVLDRILREFETLEEKENVKKQQVNLCNVELRPIISFGWRCLSAKIGFKVGEKHLYKVKNIVEFADNVENEETHAYGAKLNFTHKRDSFTKDSMKTLDYLVKKADAIRDANKRIYENCYSESEYQRNMIKTGSVEMRDENLDDIYELYLGEIIEAKSPDGDKRAVQFVLDEFDFSVSINKKENGKYSIEMKNEDELIFMDGKTNSYIYFDGKIYKVSKAEAKKIKICATNIRDKGEIEFEEKDLERVLTVIAPQMRGKIDLEKVPEEAREKYIPKELGIRLFLDMNKNNEIVLDSKFEYGDVAFNPLESVEVSIPRNLKEEEAHLEKFKSTGFMANAKTCKFVLKEEGKIYEFLSHEIEDYMKKYEVLATENFRNKEVKQPVLNNIGVRIENNLLNIDFTGMNIDFDEIADVMNKYKTKQKYHRLKNGEFVELTQNSSLDLIENLTEGLDVDYSKYDGGKLELPMYRSMYLERVLERAQEIKVDKNEDFKNLTQDIADKNNEEDIALPKTIKAKLRGYQKVGYNWLGVLDRYKLGGVLADDMGLGKTLQLISVLLKYAEENKAKAKPSIVVCPSSLTLNWVNEIEKFAPKLKVLNVSGTAKQRKEQIENIKGVNVLITSYDSLKRDIEEYVEGKCKFKYIIADEAQYIKNNSTQNFKAIKRLNSEIRYALTGTPIENSLAELWSLFDFIMPGYLFGYKKFKDTYENPIVKKQDEKALKKLKMFIEPFILRRVKKEVLTELPDKTITLLKNEMKDEQLKIYSSFAMQAKKEAMKEIASNGFEKSHIKILALLSRLRQICCHPSLFIENYDGESSKLEQCIEVVREAIEAGHKILLFSGFTSMFEIVEKELEKENIKYFKLTGQTKVAQRIKMVDEFNENPDVKIFLISLKAGGTGLNLVGADMVIHYDPWWNLSAENQATDRTYRIGQKRNVQVYKLITKNTIEEKIHEMQQRKGKLADNMLSTETTFINKLSKDDLLALFE